MDSKLVCKKSFFFEDTFIMSAMDDFINIVLAVFCTYRKLPVRSLSHTNEGARTPKDEYS